MAVPTLDSWLASRPDPALGGLTDYNGNAITGFGSIGFDPVPALTLAVVETMPKQYCRFDRTK